MTKRPKYNGAFPLFVGMLALGLLVGGIGAWSVRTEIAGAIIAPGEIVVENSRQVVQHAEGGTVAEIFARDGDQIAEGGLLLRLDNALFRSELAVVELQLVEFMARRARFEAERDETSGVAFPRGLVSETGDAAREQIEGQHVLFEARRETFLREDSQLEERIRQTVERIAGAEAQIEALVVQLEVAEAKLTRQEELFSRGVSPSSRVSDHQSEPARLAGEIGRLTSSAAEFKGDIEILAIERVRLRNARRETAISELRHIRFRELELTEQKKNLLKRLSRLEIRAPVAGTVFGSTVFAPNAVIKSAEPLMYLVPQDLPLIVSARVEAIHIDQVHVGQSATLRFTAFNQRPTPEIAGQVITVSADVFRDEIAGTSYYLVDVYPLQEEIQKLEGQDLLPGMPVEAFLKTSSRTPLSFLTKPLTDSFAKAFREG